MLLVGQLALRPVLAVKSCWSCAHKFHASVSVSHLGATGRRALCRTLELPGGQSSRAEGWAPLRAVPCVASRWRVRPVDGGGSPAGLGSWSCAASFLGLGERLWECPVARRCRSRPLPFSRWVFVLRSLWFLFWARTLQFHSTEGAAGRRAFFLFQLAFPPSCGSGCRRPERPSLPSVSGFSF